MKGPRIVVPRFVSLVIAASLLAGLSLAVLGSAPAQQQRPDNRRHLLLVPTDAEGTAALERTDARVLARYESFSVVEARGSDVERLRDAGAERRDDMLTVETAAGELDPAAERTPLAGKDAPDRDEALVLVQFVGPPKEAWLRRLTRTGARVVTYQAENSYVVHARGAAVDRVAALQGGHPAVRSVSVITSADKIEDRSSPSGLFAVTTVTGNAGADARDEAAQAGGTAAAPVVVEATRTDYRRLSSDEVARLARDPAVVAVEAYAEPELFDERAAQVVAGNLTGSFVPTVPTYLDWLTNDQSFPTTTFDFAIDVSDEGLDNIDTDALDTAHRDFREGGIPNGDTRVAYAANYTSDADVRDCGGHGTNVASLAAGYNTQSSSEWEDPAAYNHGLGVAPFARIGASKIFDCNGDFSSAWAPAAVASAAHAGGARISNNSWGTGSLSSWGDYSPRSAAYDQLVRDARPSHPGNQELVEVFAAGNDGEDNPGISNEGYGTIAAEGSAKNVITVGAAESVRQSGTDGCGVPNAGANSARDIIDFSSRGPTDDGRLKPDLVAPGTHVTGAVPINSDYQNASHPHGVCNKYFTGTTWYSIVSGSSQAAPQVSGAAALLRAWYRRTESPDASPALTKALLVNTATDLAGGQTGKGGTIAAGPNTDQGWGRVNVGNVFDSTARVYRDQTGADTLDASGESRVRSYSVPDPSRPVKVTLAWTDAPGPTTGSAAVNNLDLVVDAGGRTYKGNNFAGAWSRTGGTADPRNNVESVYLPAGTAARLAVNVIGTSIAGDGVPGVGDATDQDFALVVSNAAELPPTPVLSGESPQVTDAEPGGDGDGALEPGESFGVDQAVRNGGDGAATGVDGTMSAAAPLSFTEAASGYPDAPPGGSSTNTTRFAGELSAAATCGADVTATLTLDTDQGVQEVPVVLSTGYPGAPVPRSAGGGPIPDDSAAGVSSTIEVDPTGPAGRIRDIDVSISRITHGWVGDLTITLTGPDGTTVRLAEHPGGPDNGGKNFVGTVFDDEAPINISSAAAPYSGSFRPQNDELSRFDGNDWRGNWTLRVRDLFEGDTGTLEGWGTSTRTAYCSDNPETTITSAPSEGEFVANTAATFTFTATEAPGSPPFQCRLDGGAWEECDSPGSQTYTGLAQGLHTFEVRGVDAQGDVDPDPASRRWFVDTVAPSVTLDPPASHFSSAEPTFTGTAGTAFADLPPVTVRIHDSGGALVESLTTSRSGSSWSATVGPLADGAYRVRAEQPDAAGNVGSTADATFTIDTPDSPPPPPPDPPLPPDPDPIAPSFVLSPAQERMADALAGRLAVVAGCASACKVTARLIASPRASRNLGLGRRTTALGNGRKRLAAAGTARAAVHLTKRARRALQVTGETTARLRVTVVDGATTLSLNRTVALEGSAGLRRIASRGLRMWAVCSDICPLRGKLMLPARAARRIGLKPRGSARMRVAAGQTTAAAREPARLTLKVRRGARKALRNARRVRALLEAVAGAPPGPQRTAARRITLRR